ncbi:hypothetical protein E4U43_004663 [Claviceps pusilla]|uniref:Uracil-DNA glycosylase-like domain-containing protein n=1 Tax=Claviceps pusilla TaxID=123648 RepID=A0A9P7N3L9_9HYPO|nr:hypothetical protein E4U43_004663 [Claviceps pusilla]
MERDQRARPPATFQGLLQLDAFRYSCSASPGSSSSLRRNPPRAAATSPIVRRSTAQDKPSSPPLPSSRKHPSGPSATTGPSSSSPITRNPKKPKRAPRPRASTGYAPPAQYAHLPLLPDALGPNLLVLFIGLNPGISTALTGHAYAHPSNLFWKLLHSSGITPRRCHPHEDASMPALYALGLTNIVSRPTRNGSQLSRTEMDRGVAILEDKTRRWRPECVCVVGKGIWESIWRVRHGGKAVGPGFRYGWQDEAENMGVVQGEGGWAGARVFVASSTSGLAATLLPAEKESIWAELGSWVKMRRAEREIGEDANRKGDGKVVHC